MRTLAATCIAFLISAFAMLHAAEPAAPAATPPTAAADETTPRVSGTDLLHLMHHADDELVILDVRTPAEFAAGHVPGAKNIPHDQVAARLTELVPLRDKTVVLYCRSGRRSASAAAVLRSAGFSSLKQLEGDFPGWEAANHPVERGDESAVESD